MKLFKFALIAMLSLSSELLLAANQPQDLNSECKDFIKSIENRYHYDWVQVSETPTSMDPVLLKQLFQLKKVLN